MNIFIQKKKSKKSVIYFDMKDNKVEQNPLYFFICKTYSKKYYKYIDK